MELLSCVRVCVYIPQSHLDVFIAAVSPHIPSFLGSYDHVCWWSEAGTEQYCKISQGDVQRVLCHKFECALPDDSKIVQDFIKRIILPNHPWEEPVITLTTQKIANIM